jgi:thiamine biosynthesis protein ThiI
LSSSEPAVLVASAEFTLKSSPVRRTLEQRLIDDLKVGLTRNGLDGFKVEKDAGRIIVRGTQDAESAARCCAKVFGVAYAAPAIILPASMDSVMKTIVQLARETLKPGQSFAIRTHRATASPLSRRAIEINGGSEVLRALKDNEVKVNLKAPDLTIFVDLAGDRAYMYRQRLPGPGGLPLSSQSKMLTVLDSGPLSILAAYAMMRRGCLVEPLIPLSEAIPSFAKDQQLRLAQKLRNLVTRSSYRAFTIELDRLSGGARMSPSEYADAKYLVRLASLKLAREKKFKGVVLSDVAGEIATLQKEFIEANRINPPIFQPLIGLKNEDLFGMCKEIGISEEELLSQMEVESHRSRSVTLDFSEYLYEPEFEQIAL